MQSTSASDFAILLCIPVVQKLWPLPDHGKISRTYFVPTYFLEKYYPIQTWQKPEGSLKPSLTVELEGLSNAKYSLGLYVYFFLYFFPLM